MDFEWELNGRKINEIMPEIFNIFICHCVSGWDYRFLIYFNGVCRKIKNKSLMRR